MVEAVGNEECHLDGL